MQRLIRLIEYGTQGYDRDTRRRLKILNVVAYLIAIFTLIYAAQYVAMDYRNLAPLIALNLAMAGVALLVPFMHRISDIAGALMISASEYAGLFVFTLFLGNTSGIHIQYFAAPAAFFVIFGLRRIWLILVLTALVLVLHLAAWFLFPRERALITVDPAILDQLYVTAAFTTLTMIGAVVYYAFRLAEDARNETEALLHNILPDTIADRLTEKPETLIADSFEAASVMFADLKGFVSLAKSLGPERTVALLNELMHSFDRLAVAHGVEKIKTIGDAYMAAAGVPERSPEHAERLARMALAMVGAARQIAQQFDVELALRIGIASGPLMAGVIGAKRLTYDVWGDTVNLASRLEGQSEPGRILVGRQTRDALDGQFRLEPRGPIDIKGFGEVEAWFVIEELAAEPARAAPISEHHAAASAHRP